jgi:hypothetical protein
MASTAALDSKYPAAGVTTQQADYINLSAPWRMPGVIPGVASEFAVVQRAAGANMSVDVGSGRGIINGIQGVNGSAKNVDIAANSSGNPRIDLVTLHLDTATTPPTYQVKVTTGTPAGVPAVPALVQSGSIYEISLAEVAVADGASSITTANITDRRLWSTGFGPTRLANKASASTFVVPVGISSHDPIFLVQPVTGTVSISALSGVAPAGSILILEFGAAGGGVSSPCTGAIINRSFTTANSSGSCIAFESDGSFWNEIARAGETVPAKTVLAGPPSGSAASPSFANITGGYFGSIAGTGSKSKFLGSPAGGGTGDPSFQVLALADMPSILQIKSSTNTAQLSTSSSTPQDFTGDGTSSTVAVTLTTTGGDLLVFAWSTVSVSAAGANVSGVVTAQIDGGTTRTMLNVGTTANGKCTGAGFTRYTGVTAASHTVKLQGASEDNTATATFINTTVKLLVVELTQGIA